MNLDEIPLEKVAYEVRYPAAYYMWDSAGALLVSLTSKFPECNVVDAAPNRIVVRLDAGHEIAVELTQSRMIAMRPKRSMETTADFAKTVFGEVMRHVAPSSLSRIGARFIFTREEKTQAAAAKAVYGLNRIAVPPLMLDHLKDGDRIAYPEFAFRVEGKALATGFRVKSDTRNLEFEPNIEFGQHVESKKLKQEIVSVDVDYYTTVSVEPGQFEPASWLLAGYKSIKRDANRILEAST